MVSLLGDYIVETLASNCPSLHYLPNNLPNSLFQVNYDSWIKCRKKYFKQPFMCSSYCPAACISDAVDYTWLTRGIRPVD